MRNRRQDEFGDPQRGQGRANYATELEAVCQAIMTRLRLYEGEWFENTVEGMPLWTQILGAYGMKAEMIDRLIQERIAGTTGVTNVTIVESDIVNRQYSMTCQVDTVYGSVTITNNQGG